MQDAFTSYWDVVVVGAGNAGMSAAHAAREERVRVLVLEKAPRQEAFGNSYFTAGAIRTTFDGLDDLVALLDDPDDEQVRKTEVVAYSAADYRNDMERITDGRCDPELTRVLANDVASTVKWLRDRGLRYRLMYDRQSFFVDGRHRFFGGLVLGTVGTGQGLMEQHLAGAISAGIEVRYGHAVTGLILDDAGGVVGVRCVVDGKVKEITAGGVVLAAGGFQANSDMRAEHLGPEWRLAKVRGTPHNTGEAIVMAVQAGAERYGDWGSCHAIAWDANAPDTGDWELTNLLSKQSYPLGIVVNRDGQRFVDEGADLRNYTYAKYGAEILKQPGGIAHQLFDGRTRPLLRDDEYTAPGVSVVVADDLCELARGLDIDPARLKRTVRTFNAAVTDGPFRPAEKDGKCTVGIDPPKSNWAVPLESPPFYGFSVTCGITFTFGGLHIDVDGRVLRAVGKPIAGLYAAGELVGGLFSGNYPGGTGLAAGAVFGRRAGRTAAVRAGAHMPAIS